MVQPMTTAELEEGVFSKPQFDPQGLIVAEQDGHPIAFAHAGFGPTDAGDGLDTDLGTTYQIRVHADHADASVEEDLLGHSQDYLRSRGATVLYGGGIHPLNGFYLGLYGGSELPGILDSDPNLQDVFNRCGYHTIDRVIVFHSELSLFRSPISRQFRDCSRRCRVEMTADPAAGSWWEACTSGAFDRLAYDLVDRGTGQPIARADLWHMEPMATNWGIRAMGLQRLEVDPEYRRRGMATCLLSNILSDLRQQGVALVEAQTMQNNEPALGLYRRLGFFEVDRGSVYRK